MRECLEALEAQGGRVDAAAAFLLGLPIAGSEEVAPPDVTRITLSEESARAAPPCGVEEDHGKAPSAEVDAGGAQGAERCSASSGLLGEVSIEVEQRSSKRQRSEPGV